MNIPRKVYPALRSGTTPRSSALAAPAGTVFTPSGRGVTRNSTAGEPPASATLPRSLIVGLGNGGCQTVSALEQQWKEGPRFALVDTDGRSLGHSGDLARVQIGAHVIKGLGTGGEPRLGRRAAEADIGPIRELFQDVELVFLVVCLGGGTGTGAAPLLVEAARKAGALTLCFASLPFEFEGSRRMEHAQRGILALQAVADAVICLPNQRLLKLVSDRANISAAFQKADELLASSLQALWCVLSRRGVINLDLSDVRALAQKGNGQCLLAYAEGRGPDKINQVLSAVREHELLNQGTVLAEADSILVSIMGGSDLSLKEVDQLMADLAKLSRADALMMTGLCCQSDWQDRLFVVFLVSEKRGAGDLAQIAAQRHEPPGPALAGATQAGQRLKESGTRDKIKQAGLFDDVGRGRFKDVETTIVNGENLDIPTFKRRGVMIQKAQRNTIP